MSLYVIGDLHLSQSVEKPMDIFAGWGNHTSRLVENWQAVVKPEDTVVLAGDISWGMTLEEARADFALIHSLPGKKIVLKGNHDYWWQTMRKLEAWLAEEGFDSIQFLFNNAFVAEDVGICGTRGWTYDEAEPDNDKVFRREVGRLRMSLDALDKLPCGERVAFLHYPPIHRNTYATSIIETLKEFGVSRCYYGHLHGGSIPHAFNGTADGIAFQLISADHLGFMPYLVKK